MQGRLLRLIARRLHSSTSQLSSFKRFSSSSEVALAGNLSLSRPTQHSEKPQSYEQYPSENFANSESHSNSNSNPSPNPNPPCIPNLEPNPNPNPNPDPEVNKCIWAVERVFKGKRFAIYDRKKARVPGFVYDQDSPPDLKHLLILMDKLQIQSLFHHLGEEKFLRTVFTLEVFDGFGSSNILYRLLVLPRRINFNNSGEICNVGYARAPPGMKLRLDVPIRISGQDDCKGIKKGGSLKIHLLYASLFCLPEELPPYVEIHVNDMDIGDRISLGDLRIVVPLSSNTEPSLPICEII